MHKLLFGLCLFSLACGGIKPETENVTVSSVATTQESLPLLSLAEIEEAIIANPESPNGYYKRALYYKDRMSFINALKDIENAVELAPNVPEMVFEKADILFRLAMFKGDISLLDESRLHLEEVLKLDSVNENAHLLLAQFEIAQENLTGALAHVNTVLKSNKTSAKAYHVKGKIFEINGELANAESSYQTAIEMNANFYDAYISLGIIQGAQGHETAIVHYNSALKINPNSMEAVRNKGLFYYEQERFEEARTQFKEMLKLDSLNEEAYFNLGNTYVQVFRDDMDAYTKDTIVDRAKMYFSKAVEINPTYVQAIHNLGRCFEATGNVAKAKGYYNEALKLDPVFKPSLESLEVLGK